MDKIINLIKNENMKLAYHISTWIMIVILVIITIISGFVTKFAVKHENTGNWKQNLIEDNIKYQKEIDKKQINSRIKSYDKDQLKINEYRIKHNKKPIDDNSLWGFVSDTGNEIMLISLFTIILGSGIVANEFSSGTIKLLLIRPAKRWKILLSKYITVMEWAFFMLVILFLTSFLTGVILFGFKGVNEPFIKYSNGHIFEVNMIIHTFGDYGLDCINLIMMVTLAFMISTVFRNSALAIGISVFLLTIGSTITVMLSQTFSWAKYILFANTDLTQYTSGTPLIKGMTMSFSISVIIVYYVIFNIISYLGFTKREVGI